MARHVTTPDCLPDCFGCKIQSISIAASAMPSRSEAAKVEIATKKQHKDVAAYKRLRKDGVQPKTVKGAAELESRAASKWEVETGMNLGGSEKLGKRYDEAQSAIAAGQGAA